MLCHGIYIGRDLVVDAKAPSSAMLPWSANSQTEPFRIPVGSPDPVRIPNTAPSTHGRISTDANPWFVAVNVQATHDNTIFLQLELHASGPLLRSITVVDPASVMELSYPMEIE